MCIRDRALPAGGAAGRALGVRGAGRDRALGGRSLPVGVVEADVAVVSVSYTHLTLPTSDLV